MAADDAVDNAPDDALPSAPPLAEGTPAADTPAEGADADTAAAAAAGDDAAGITSRSRPTDASSDAPPAPLLGSMSNSGDSTSGVAPAGMAVPAAGAMGDERAEDDGPRVVEKPTCPLMRNRKDGSTLKMSLMRVTVEVHMATAFVTVHGQWFNQHPKPVDGVFEIPMSTRNTITNVTVFTGKRQLETTLVPSTDVAKYVKGMTDTDIEFQRYFPDVFRLPVPSIKPGEAITVTCSYYQDLWFAQGNYTATVPLVFADSMLPNSVSLTNAVSLEVAINAGTPNCQWGCASHRMRTELRTEERIVLHSDHDTDEPWPNADFQISYNVWSNEILSSCIVEPAQEGDADPRGAFAVFVAPPDRAHVESTFGRSVVFLIDKSGSMAGQPMDEAKSALLIGLNQLRPEDSFNIVAFNGRQFWWNEEGLRVADTDTVQEARRWVAKIGAGGLTDIMTPLQGAIEQLERDADRVPYAFLITDGAVENERDICKYIKETKPRTRLMTFGIGPYCNTVFLRMAAQMGRGYSDVCLEQTRILEQITHLFEMAEVPVMTDLKLVIEGLKSCEVYPYPLPDLFCGAPLVISGRFEGDFPPNIEIGGTLPGGRSLVLPVEATTSKHIPIAKVFVKQRIDMLTAHAWLTENEDVRRMVVELSIQESMPSAHTTMLVCDTNKDKVGRLSKSKRKARKRRLGLLGMATTVLVVGAVGASFGSVAATLDNVSILDAFSGVAGGGEFGELGSFGDAAGGACDGCFECMEGCWGCMRTCFEAIASV